jgi:hypothetical protein
MSDCGTHSAWPRVGRFSFALFERYSTRIEANREELDPVLMLAIDVHLFSVCAGRVMKFTSAKDITAKAATIKAYVREAIAVEKAGLRMKRRGPQIFRFPRS